MTILILPVVTMIVLMVVHGQVLSVALTFLNKVKQIKQVSGFIRCWQTFAQSARWRIFKRGCFQYAD
jgi:hypothetical protein